jgi:anti-sigma factor ChrR (cupin superfamily)
VRRHPTERELLRHAETRRRDAARRIAVHVRSCPRCARRVRLYAVTLEAVRQALASGEHPGAESSRLGDDEHL